MIYSCYKLTYDPSGAPVVLLAVGDRIEAEPEFGLEKNVEIVSLVDAAAPFIRIGKNAVVNFSITRALDSATDKEARSAILDSLVASSAATKKPLKIEVSGYSDRYWQFSAATIRSHRPRRYLESPSARWIQTFEIVATGLAYVPPSP